MKEFQQLERLELTRFKFEKVFDDFFSNFSKLTRLALKRIHINLHTNMFAALKNLKELRFIECDQWSTEMRADVFGGLEHLQKLRLKLRSKSMPKDMFDSMKKLQVLDLSSNGKLIEAISSSLLYYFVRFYF